MALRDNVTWPWPLLSPHVVVIYLVVSISAAIPQSTPSLTLRVSHKYHFPRCEGVVSFTVLFQVESRIWRASEMTQFRGIFIFVNILCTKSIVWHFSTTPFEIGTGSRVVKCPQYDPRSPVQPSASNKFITLANRHFGQWDKYTCELQIVLLPTLLKQGIVQRFITGVGSF